MNSTEHTDIEDLAMFALLLLSEDEAELVRVHQEGCAQCQAELAQVREDLALYAMTVPPVPLPEGVRTRFLSQLEQEASPIKATPSALSSSLEGRSGGAAAVPTPVSPGPVSLPHENEAATLFLRVLPWIGWAAAAAAIIVAAGLKQDRDALRTAFASQNADSAQVEAELARDRHILSVLTDPSAVRVNLTTSKAPAVPTAKATYEQKSGTLLLMASNLPALQPAKVYELWLIPADGSKPLPAGTFSPDARGNASLLVPSLHGAVAAKAFGITVEQSGGAQTPTLPILLAGAPA